LLRLARFHARSKVEVDGELGVTPYPVCAKADGGTAMAAARPIKAIVLSMVLFPLGGSLIPREAVLTAIGDESVAVRDVSGVR
jgi:hypothetical protein